MRALRPGAARGWPERRVCLAQEEKIRLRQLAMHGAPTCEVGFPDAAGRRRTPESRLAGQRPSFSASLRMSCRPRTARLAASEACACEAWSSLPSFDRSLNIRHCASAGIRLRVSYSPTANHITYNPFSRAKAAENPPGLFGENAQFRCKVKPLGDAP